MQSIKATFIILLSWISIYSAQAQYSFGAAITPGIGYMRSGQLKQAGEAVEDNNSEILNYDYKTKSVFQMGFHGVAQYRLSHQWTVLAMPGVYFFRANNTGYYRSTLDGSNGDYYQYKIESLAKLRSTQFVLPIMAKYYIIPDRPYFATAGLQLTISGKTKMISEEDSITSYFTLGELYSSTSRNYTYTKKLEEYKPFQLHLSLGVGASILTGYFHNLDIQLNWLIPVTASDYYTNDSAINDYTLLNNVYGSSGRASIENSSGKNVDRFRTGVLSLTLRYMFYNKVQ